MIELKKINKKNLLMQKNGSKNTTIKLTNTNKQIDKNIMLVNYGEFFSTEYALTVAISKHRQK